MRVVLLSIVLPLVTVQGLSLTPGCTKTTLGITNLSRPNNPKTSRRPTSQQHVLPFNHSPPLQQQQQQHHTVVRRSIARLRRDSSILFSSSSSSSSDDDDKLAKKITGRKKRVTAGYRITTIANIVIGALLIITTSVRHSFGIIGSPYFGAGYLLASGVSYVLTDAAINDRLSSDTYKRLNLVLGEFSLVAGIGFYLMKSPPLVVAACVIALVNAIKGYGYGLKGWALEKNSAAEDILTGLKSSLICMTKLPNVKSLGYWGITVTLGTMKLAKLYEIIMDGTTKTFVVGTRLVRLAKLMLMTIVAFTLKDAADRDRLEGTTFIELNLMMSLTLASMAAHTYGKTGMITTTGIAASSAFAAFNGIASHLKKRAKKA